MRIFCSTLFLLLALFSQSQADDCPTNSVAAYNPVFTSPNANPQDSMPLGNGEVGVNAWVEPGGDLLLLLARTDAWDDYGRLVKIGRLRVKVSPNPLAQNARAPFLQKLHLEDATLRIHLGEGDDLVTLTLWVDANQDVVELRVESANPTEVSAKAESWRKKPFELKTPQMSDVGRALKETDERYFKTIIQPDTVLTNLPEGIGWFHHNRKSFGPKFLAKLEGVADFKRKQDPLLDRVFGAILSMPGAKRENAELLVSPKKKVHSLRVAVNAAYPSSPEAWERETLALLAKKADKKAHDAWWERFWQRSWIHISNANLDDLVKGEGSFPHNENPLQIGASHKDSTPTPADAISQFRIYDRPLDEKEVAKLAANPKEQQGLPKDGLLLNAKPPQKSYPQEVPELQDWNAKQGFTVSAWVSPKKVQQIVGKITPNRKDGLLLDIIPAGKGLRLVCGDKTFFTHKAFKSADATHVAVVVEPEARTAKFYVGGKVVFSGGPQQPGNTTTDVLISRAYACQRYVAACVGRGNYPIKFNGSLFVTGTEENPDNRRWGPGYWWQNTRLSYHGMCAAGDYEMMKPLFKMYIQDLLPFWKYRSKKHTGHEGLYIPECCYFWGNCFPHTYGLEPFEEREDKLQVGGWHKYEWIAQLELLYLALDLHDHTGDDTVLSKDVFSLADETFTFFEQHYAKRDKNGKLLMHPSQALETWWDCTNPMPEIAGLRSVAERLLALDKKLTTEKQRKNWKRFYQLLPPLPTRKVDGVAMLAPAEKFDVQRNHENPELYAVFPFRQITHASPQRELAKATFERRAKKLNFGWCQDSVNAAYLGEAKEAARLLAARSANVYKKCRFPAMWSKGFNELPDQDHGALTLRTLQAMLLRSERGKIYLLPAFPKNWDVQFKLRAPLQTTVECELKNGKIERLKVTPESRRKDVVLPW